MLIEEYFRQIENDIAECLFIIETEIKKDRRSYHIGIVEGKIRFTDHSVLHFIEFVNVKNVIEKYKSAYHFQNQELKLIFRYDMAPHHKGVNTFPHHKHLSPEHVVASSEPTLRQVLCEIEGYLEKKA